MREIYLLFVALTCVITLYIHNAIKKDEERRVSNQPVLLLLRSHDANILYRRTRPLGSNMDVCHPPDYKTNGLWAWTV